MANQNQDYYYAGGKKVKLNRLPDSFALRYKESIPQRAMERKLTERLDLAEAEERKEMPRYRLVIVTLPPSRRLADEGATLESLERDEDVEFITSVYREPQSGLRLIATDEITVRFKSDTSQEAIAELNEDNGVEIAKKNRFVPNQYLLRVKNPQETLNLANKYQESDLTEFAEPNFVSEFKKASLPNDELLNEQWHLRNLGQGGGLVGEDVEAEGAWEFTQGSPDITIAIIDDGVDIEHPDLQANIWNNPNPGEPDVNGWNFYNDNSNPRPQKFTPPYHRLEGNDSHGTPCAGVAAAVGDNTEGVTGIAYRCKILPVKIFMADDLVPFNVLADAIRYAGGKADVLSNSWGTPRSSDVEQAIKDVVLTGRGGKGCPVFVATGNGFSSTIGFPARVPEAIAVGASTNQGRRSDYSNYGEGIDFVAPSNGGTKGIFTTDVSISGRGFNVGNVNSGDAEGLYTNSFGGTSSATPLAAGIAALMLSLNPDLTWQEVRKYMGETADKIDQGQGNYVNGYSLKYGFGRVNARKALKAVKDDLNGDGDIQVIEKVISPNLAIPDNNREGISSSIQIEQEGTIDSIESITVNISHSYRGDLLVSLISPDRTTIALHQGQGGGADNLIETYDLGTTPALQQLVGKGVRGQWVLKAIDRWSQDTGTLNNWGLKIKIAGHLVRGSAEPGMRIPDNDPTGIISKIDLSQPGQVKDIKVRVDISHTYINDLTVKLLSPSDKIVTLHDRTGGNQDNIEQEYSQTTHPALANLLGENIFGAWKLAVTDNFGADIGKLNKWEIEIKI